MASLHDTFLFYACRNYNDANDRITVRGASTLVPEMADNDYTTFSDEADVDVDVSDGSDPTRVHAICYKGTGVTSYTATPTGGTGTAQTRTIPSTVENFQGRDVSTSIGGLTHDLFLLPSDGFTATEVRVQFTGTNIQVAVLALLEIAYAFDSNNSKDFLPVAPPRLVDRTGRLQTGRQARRLEALGGDREKWEYTYRLRVLPGKSTVEDIDEYLQWRSVNKNFFFGYEPSNNPWRVHPATFPQLQVSAGLPGGENWKRAANVIEDEIWEQ